MIYWPAKAPGATLAYEFDWSGGLGEGFKITNAVVAATGVTVVSSSFTDKTAKVEISDGTLGAPGVVSCTITTDDPTSPTDVETAILPIGEEPVSLTMAKAQLRYEDETVEDGHILGLIQAAREHVEKYTGTALVPAAVTMTFDRFESLGKLTKGPVQSITEVKYLDANGVEQTLDPATYEFINVAADPLRPRIRLAFNQSWPAVRCAEDAVRVSAVVGYTVVPMPLIRVIQFLVALWFDERNPVAVDVRGVPTELPHTVEALLANFRL
jgi:uncharacterized phiE125 gp8 family phage protein